MRIAVVVHAFYPEVFQDIATHLKRLNQPIDLYITTPHKTESLDCQGLSYKVVETTENLGMDVLPFISVVNKYRLWTSDLVIKLHSKNNLSQKSKDMMQIYLDSLLTDGALSAITLSMNSQQNIGLWGPLAFARSVEKLIYRNRDKLEKLKDITGCYHPQNNVLFFAGTMFGIRGFLLKKLSLQCDRIRHLVKLENVQQDTSGDGSYAHALERLFPILVKSQAYNIGIINPREFSQEAKYTVFEDKEYASDSYEKYFQLGSNDTSGRWLNLQNYLNSDYSEIIDFVQYSKAPFIKQKWNINLTAHYLFFGDHLRETWLFEKNFSSSLYRIVRTDVFRAGVPSAYHYISRGRTENPTLFTDSMCRELLSKYFPNKYTFHSSFNLLIKNTDFRQILSEMGNMEVITKRKNSNTTYYFSFLEMRKVSLLELLEYYLPEVTAARDLLKLQIEHDDFIGAMATAENTISQVLPNPDLVEILAICYTLNHEWDLAIQYWKLYQQSMANANLLFSLDSNRLISYDMEYEPSKIFAGKTSFCNTNLSENTLLGNPKICIYTSLFGNYDDLPLLETDIPTEIDLIAFTDHKRLNADKRWKQVICKPQYTSNNLSAKEYKILPHKYLQEYSYSLFVDANTVFTKNIDLLILMLLDSGNFTMWRHPFRTDLLKEACAILGWRRAQPRLVIEQMRTYITAGIPRDTGLCEGSFIWRKHSDTSIVDFMEEWWEHIQRYTHRDQLGLCFLMWQKKLYPKLISDELGTSRENVFFYKIPHKG